MGPLACWDCGFEYGRGHGCLSVLSVVFCQIEVSAMSWSLFQRSPTVMCRCEWFRNHMNEEAVAHGGCRTKIKNYPNIIFTDSLRQPHVACYPRRCHPWAVRKPLFPVVTVRFFSGGGRRCLTKKKLVNGIFANICTLFDRFS